MACAAALRAIASKLKTDDKAIDDIIKHIEGLEAKGAKIDEYAANAFNKRLFSIVSHERAVQQQTVLLNKTLNRTKDKKGYTFAFNKFVTELANIITGTHKRGKRRALETLHGIFDKRDPLVAKKLKDLYGEFANFKAKPKFSSREVFEALKDPSKVDDPLLKEFALSLREFEEITSTHAVNAGLISKRKDYTTTQRISADAVSKYSKEEFIMDMSKYIDRTHFDSDEGFEVFVSRLYDIHTSRTTTRTGGDKNISYHSRELTIRDEFEFEFLEKYGSIQGDVVNGLVNHGKQLIADASLYSSYGSEPNLLISKLANHAKATSAYTDKDFVSTRVDRTKDRANKILDYTFNPHQHGNLMWYYLGRGIDSSVSGVLTTLSGIRNAVFDTNINTALVSKFHETGGYAKVTGEQITNLAKSATSKAHRQYLNDYVREWGAGLTFDWNSKVITFLDSTEGPGRQAITPGEKFAKLFASMSESVSALSIKVSLTDKSFDLQKARSMIRLNSRLTGVLESKGFDELDDVMRGRLEAYNIDKVDYDTLRQIISKKKAEGPFNTKLIRFEDLDDIVPPKRKGETEFSARERLRTSLGSMFEDFGNESVGIPNDIYRAKYSAKKYPEIDILARQIGKFLAVADSQWSYTYKAARAGTGQVHNKPETSDNIKALLSISANYILGGVLIAWAKDIVNGKTPRSLNIKDISTDSLSAGLGGVYGSAFLNLWYSQSLGGRVGYRPPVASVASDMYSVGKVIYDELEEGDGDMDRLYRSAKKLAIFPNLWYTRALFDSMVRDSFNIPLSDFVEEELERRNQKLLVDKLDDL